MKYHEIKKTKNNQLLMFYFLHWFFGCPKFSLWSLLRFLSVTKNTHNRPKIHNTGAVAFYGVSKKLTEEVSDDNNLWNYQRTILIAGNPDTLQNGIRSPTIATALIQISIFNWKEPVSYYLKWYLQKPNSRLIIWVSDV